MKTQLLLAVTILVLAAGTSTAKPQKSLLRERSQETRQTAEPATSSVVEDSSPTTLEQIPLSTNAAPTSGEQIKWWVVGAGGGTSASTNYKLGSTLGQTAAGMAQSASYKLNQGFWQSSSGCCIGTTGNVNMTGIVDLGDLSLLVAFLTNSPATKPTLPCVSEANVNNSGIVDLGDLALLVAFLVNPTGSKPTLPNCP